MWLGSCHKGKEDRASRVMAELSVWAQSEDGRALAWPWPQAVHVVLQNDSFVSSQCCALPLGRCHDRAAFSLCRGAGTQRARRGGP